MNKVNNFFVKEPRWRDANSWFLGSVPAPILDWLLEPCSLTQRLKTTFSAPFGVSVLAQAWARPSLTEVACLKQAPTRSALIREVFLTIGEQPAVFARSTLPREAAFQLQGLSRLGSKPLGEVIFAYPDLQRVRLEFTKISLNQLSPLIQQKLSGQRYIWGRRNSYQIAGQVFLVSEFFLPDLFE